MCIRDSFRPLYNFSAYYHNACFRKVVSLKLNCKVRFDKESIITKQRSSRKLTLYQNGKFSPLLLEERNNFSRIYELLTSSGLCEGNGTAASLVLRLKRFRICVSKFQLRIILI